MNQNLMTQTTEPSQCTTGLSFGLTSPWHRIDGWMDGWMDGRMDGWTDGRMDGWTDGRMDGWTDGRMDGWTDGRMDGWTDGRMDGWTDGRMDGWTDGRMDGWMDGWIDKMDGCMGACMYVSGTAPAQATGDLLSQDPHPSNTKNPTSWGLASPPTTL